MSLSTDDLIKIVEVGGGLMLDGGSMSKEDLLRLAAAAGKFEAGVTLRNLTGTAVDDLVEISRASDGYVTFDL
jgi:hypothetical protein